MYSSMPRREYEGLWINCLLYAVDVVLIAAPEVIPRLLKKAEEHSVSPVYYWNLAKCVVFNSPSIYGARRLQRYGSPISNADSLCILVYLLISKVVSPLISSSAATLPLPLPLCEEHFCPLNCVLLTSLAWLPAVYMQR
ncbi:hypothetical protein RMCBS344292_18654 [Rhizopus microsporus]|nr:hypothetical protein RMCBS344292_18654 [Rhizopus microsporus]